MPRLTLKQRAAELAQGLLVRREEEEALLQRFLTGSPPILNLFGLGGIGKTTLLRTCERQCRVAGISFAIIDACDSGLLLPNEAGLFLYSVFSIFESLINQLCPDEATQRRAFKAFIKKSEELKKELRNEKGNVGNAAFTISRETVAQTLGGAAGAVLGGIPGTVVGAAIGAGANQVIDTLRHKLPLGLHNSEDMQKSAGTAQTLAMRFAEGLDLMATSANARAVVLALDHYEYMELADEWIREALVANLGPAARVVIAGKNPLSEQWRDFESVLLRHQVQPFSEAKSRDYLIRHGITESTALADILAQARGIPWFLELLVNTPHENSSNRYLKGPSNISIERRIVHRFLAQFDAQTAQVVFAAAISLEFESDLLAELVGRSVERELQLLLDTPIIVTTAQGTFRVADIVRDVLSRHYSTHHPETVSEWSRKAADYYRRRLASADGPRTQALAWQLVYHTLHADDITRNLISGGEGRDREISIQVPTADDLGAILEIDWHAFPSQPERFSLKQIQAMHEQDENIFHIAKAGRSGDILGYSCVIPLRPAFARAFESNQLDIQDVLADAIYVNVTSNVNVDYILDSFVLRNPDEHYVGALLLRHLVSHLVNPRKLFAIVASDYGRNLVTKLKFRKIGERVSDGTRHEMFACCLYQPNNASHLPSFFPRGDVNFQEACSGCQFSWCANWKLYSGGPKGRKQRK